MPKTSRTKVSEDTYDIRMAEAQSFTSGDRVRHKVNDRIGIFLEINLGFALPEVWVLFDSDIERCVPVSCNPLNLELVNTEITDSEELPSYCAESESEPSVTVEQPITAVSLGKLTQEEAASRHQLEFQVERAFYEAGAALRELRDKRLYHSTHKTFGEYCQDRFGYAYRYVNCLIAAADVVENLQMGSIGSQILPTSERQVRALTTLEPDEQHCVWEEAVKASSGKVPPGRTVKSIVERLKQRDTTTPHIPFQAGDVVLIRGLGNPELRKYDGRWVIALRINEYSVTLALDGKDVPVKPQFLEPIDPKYWTEIKAVNERITRLQQNCELDPIEDAGLEVLRRRTCFTPKQMIWLKRMEQDYGIQLEQIS